VPGRRWGSALIAKRGRLVQVPIVGYEGWVVGGRIEGMTLPKGVDELFAFSVHVPSPGSVFKRRSYFKESIAIATRIRKEIGRAAVILAGDFNIAMARRRDGDPLFRTKAEHRTLDTIAARPIGLTSLWQCCHPDESPAQTLRWTTNPSAPYHCDGFFVPPGFADGARCDVLDSPKIRRASDHNPVVARI
jgi:endonuclease/exonuclease/phosphatase family metal-dependent hydrolase